MNVIKYFLIDTDEEQLVPAALKVFEAKTLAQILYGAQTAIHVMNELQETMQTKFLKSILAVPDRTPNIQLRLETEMLLIQVRA